MSKLVPLIFVIVGLLAGGGAGLLLRDEPAALGDAEVEAVKPTEEASEPATSESAGDRAYVKMNNQFVIPVLGETRVDALVVLSLSLETSTDATEEVYAHEAKLRDAFISVLFDFAYAGGFTDNFVFSPNLDALRFKLLEATKVAMPQKISRVLITDIVRQDT